MPPTRALNPIPDASAGSRFSYCLLGLVSADLATARTFVAVYICEQHALRPGGAGLAMDRAAACAQEKSVGGGDCQRRMCQYQPCGVFGAGR
jgi:hypothetical protein